MRTMPRFHSLSVALLTLPALIACGDDLAALPDGQIEPPPGDAPVVMADAGIDADDPVDAMAPADARLDIDASPDARPRPPVTEVGNNGALLTFEPLSVRGTVNRRKLTVTVATPHDEITIGDAWVVSHYSRFLAKACPTRMSCRPGSRSSPTSQDRPSSSMLPIAAPPPPRCTSASWSGSTLTVCRWAGSTSTRGAAGSPPVAARSSRPIRSGRARTMAPRCA
jgi:hypothetical protein